MSGATRAAGYVRVSTDEQAKHGYSLDEQVRLIRERVERDDATMDDDHLFRDEGISGARLDRPEYQRLLATAAAGALDVVYVWKLDRLGRDAEELLRARRMLGAAGVRLVSLTEGENDSTLVYGVRALVAQSEREEIGERTKIGMRGAAASGRFPTGPIPIGYRAEGIKRDRRLLVDEPSAEIVRRIFSDYLAGHGLGAIARRLNNDGVRTPGGVLWTTRQIAQTLDNPIYAGLIRLKGETFPGLHDAIVDDETWKRTREIRSARRDQAGKGRGRPPAGHHIFVGGVLKCDRCGGAMTPRKRGKYESYICRAKHTYKACDGPSVARGLVDEPFLDYFEQMVLDREGSLRAVVDEADRRVDEALGLAKLAEREVLRLTTALDRADDDYGSGKLDADDYTRLRGRWQDERRAAEAEAERLREHARQLEEQRSTILSERELAERLVSLREEVSGRLDASEDLDALRVAIAATFDEVVFTVDDDGKRWLLPYLRWERLRGEWQVPVERRVPLVLSSQRDRRTHTKRREGSLERGTEESAP